MNKILKGAIVLLIAMAMVFSTVVVANTKTLSNITLTTTSYGSGTSATEGLAWDWDNGMEFISLGAAQRDDSYPFYCYIADDFQFEKDTYINEVSWIGGYWGGDPAEFDWRIAFMYDDGSGKAPNSQPETPSYAGPFWYAWTDIYKKDLGDGYYQMRVYLPDYIKFLACEKFWISIWGVGFYPPQSGWGLHETPIMLNPAVWASDIFGYPFWTPGSSVFFFDHDMCFQLRSIYILLPPSEPTIDGPSKGGAGVEKCWTFHSTDKNGDKVRYYIDWGNGTSTITDWVSQCEPIEVCHTYTEKGTYKITAFAEDITGLVGPSAKFTYKTPRSKVINQPLLLRFLEQFPNRFPILKQLLGFL